jgi:hypothetical protein
MPCFIPIFSSLSLMINRKDNGQYNQIHQNNMYIIIMKITLRSLVWMGYIAYHTINSKIFGGVYIGKGIKNYDLCF